MFVTLELPDRITAAMKGRADQAGEISLEAYLLQQIEAGRIDAGYLEPDPATE